MVPQLVTIPAAIDGYPLAALLLEPASLPQGVVQVHSGTGYKKEFYLKLATYLAEQGWAVVLFDYRGIGGSRPASGLKGFEAYMRWWGQRDMTGVLDWVATAFRSCPVLRWVTVPVGS